MQPLPQAALAVLVAAVLAWFGAKKRSLSREGAVAAFVVGLISFAASTRSGALLIAFYQSGSSLTKFKAARKATLDASSSDASDGRGAEQVLACSLLAALLSLLSLLHHGMGVDAVCDREAGPLHAAILCGLIGHYACCAGDTWASELGILDPFGPPRLLTNPFRSVPPGTNGAVSVTGVVPSTCTQRMKVQMSMCVFFYTAVLCRAEYLHAPFFPRGATSLHA